MKHPSSQEKKKMTTNDTIARRSFLAGTAALAAGVPFVLNRRSLAQDASPVTVAGLGGVTDIDALERVEIDLLPPPLVHVHEQVAPGAPRVVAFRMVIEEKPMVVDDLGTTLWAMTFHGSMPGPLMVVHQDDYVELTLV